MPVLTINKKAKFDYELLGKYEAGLVLTGQEVKSIKTGHVDLKGAYVTLKINQKTGQAEAYLINAFVPAYKLAGPLPDYDTRRSRKLLLNKRELKSLIGKTQTKGLTLVPIRVYTKHNLVKLEFAIGRGKKKVDKREAIKKRDVERRIRVRMKN